MCLTPAAATLGGALDAFCAEARKQYSRAVFRVAPGGSTAWFVRERIDGSPDEKLQVELYVVERSLSSTRRIPCWPRTSWAP